MSKPATTRAETELVAEDRRTRELVTLATRVAASDVVVMISGESGTGKEVLARYIHHRSSRAAGPYVAINCAAIPENMLEAALFGYERGAYTGAYQSHAGKFEQAQGGTLLLDEISEMDPGLQAKLLRVIQEREVERLGGTGTVPLDVRVLASTNRNLREAVLDGRFREDLFYRLNVFPLLLPPLRERPGDVLPLALSMLERHTQGTSRPNLTAAACQCLQAHSWPGNVRELENVIQRALILKSGADIEATDICLEEATDRAYPDPGARVTETGADPVCQLEAGLRQRERELIVAALVATQGSRKAAADRLGISPRTLRYKLSRLRDIGLDIHQSIGMEFA